MTRNKSINIDRKGIDMKVTVTLDYAKIEVDGITERSTASELRSIIKDVVHETLKLRMVSDES